MLKFLLAAALLGSLGGAAGGTLAARQQHPAPKVEHVTLSLHKPGASTVLRLPEVQLAAGDRMQRPFDLSLRSSYPVTGLVLTTTARHPSALTSDPVRGLRLQITRCPSAWRQAAGSRRYTCRGPVTTVVSSRRVLGTNMPLYGLSDLQVRATAHLLLTVALPGSAPNSLQGKSAGLVYRFSAVEGR